MRNRLIDQLVRDEGVRLQPYRDTAGKLTIGIGRNLDDVGISHATAEQMLEEDIDKAEAAVAKTFPWTAALTETRRAVLVAMAFNMGIARLSDFVITLRSVREGDYTRAANQMLQSRWADQVGERARRLSAQMRTGWWDGVPPRVEQVNDVTGPVVAGGLD